MFKRDAEAARAVIATGWITVKEIRPGYWQPASLADLNAIRLACDCRNGKPTDYDKLLEFVGKFGLGLQIIEEMR